MEEALIKRVLPHSLEAEQSVIGSMLMDREAVIAASEIITGSDFISSSTALCLMLWWSFLTRENRWIWLLCRIV